MPGDVLFIVGGILPFLYITWLGVRRGIRATVTRMEPETLYVEETPEAHEDRTGTVRAVAPVQGAGRAAPHTGTARPRSPYASDRRHDGEDAEEDES